MDITQDVLPELSSNLLPPEPLEDQIFDEPPPLQYARSNSLARDHLRDQLAFSELAKLQTAVQHGLTDGSELSQFDFGSEVKVEERITISREVALLLSSVSQEDTAEVIDALVLPMFKTRSNTKKARLELPLLRTDHENDCKNFARRDDFEIKLCEIKLPLEMVIEENNEGLVWPSKFSSLGEELVEQLKQEKISVSRDVLSYLQDVLKDDWTEEDDKSLWESEQRYKRNTALEPVTPPLSPLRTPLEPYEPSMSDPVFQLPILSDASSPTKHVLEALEQKIFEKDVPTPLRKSTSTAVSEGISSDACVGHGTITLGEVYSPLASLENSGTPPPVEIQRMKREDFKVEEPLTPEMPQAAPKSVHFSDIVEEMGLYPATTTNSPAYDNKFFEEAFDDALKNANQRAEQERLIEADSTARIDVPVMDFSKPDPPWKAFEQQRGSASLLSLQKLTIQELVGHPRPWSGTGLVATNMNWVPFPASLARVALEEPFKDDDLTWEAFVNDPREEKVINSSDLTWKPPGLRILEDEEEDDDDIEPAKFLTDNVQDLSTLIKKRRMELDQNEIQNKEINKTNTKTVTHLQRRTPKPNDLMRMSPGHNMHNDLVASQGFGLLAGSFSAANSIDNYLELRGTKKPKLMGSSYFQPATKVVHSLPKSPSPQLDPKAQAKVQFPIRQSPVAADAGLPTPTLEPLNTDTYIIVSSTLLKHRSLVKQLEALLPNLRLVERDFSAHNTTSWMPGSVSRSPIKSPLDSEADIIVSPSMGIVITTLQKIKQKPLPGQKAKTAIRERLDQVSTRYEKLAVYVSEGRSDATTNGLDANDCLDFASFAGFVLGLNSSNTVQFVGGGEETLSKWVASTIAQNRVVGDSTLIEEETHWEMFLRRAGLNAFAAQAIIAELKEPEGVNPLSPSKAGLFGIVAFVEMTVEQRIARFGPLCGRGLIERVSAVIDTDWRI